MFWSIGGVYCISEHHLGGLLRDHLVRIVLCLHIKSPLQKGSLQEGFFLYLLESTRIKFNSKQVLLNPDHRGILKS
jgi:hypothetical protein